MKIITLIVILSLICCSYALQCYVGQVQQGIDARTIQTCISPLVCIRINAGIATQYQCNSCVNGTGFYCCSTDLCNSGSITPVSIGFVLLMNLILFFAF